MNLADSMRPQWQMFPLADKINKLTRKIREAKWMFILPYGTWKDNIRFVNLDWRGDPLITQAKTKILWSLKRKRVVRWSLKRRERSSGHPSKHVMSVLRPSLLYTQMVPATAEKYVRTFSDSIPTSHTSPSKNKNINYMFIYLRVHHCLSDGAICDTSGIGSQKMEIFWNLCFNLIIPIKKKTKNAVNLKLCY